MVSSPALGGESYVVIDAVLLPVSEKQPKWLGIDRLAGIGRNLAGGTHIPVGKSIVPLRPGRYSIRHIDFTPNKLSSFGTLRAPYSKHLEFEVAPDSITLVGLVQIERLQKTDGGKYQSLTLVEHERVLSLACARMPELFEKLPVRVPVKDGGYELFSVSCK